MKDLTKEKLIEVSNSCIRSLVNKNSELMETIHHQELRIIQLEQALGELYNELDFSEFLNPEKSDIIEKVGRLLESLQKKNIPA